MLTLNHQRTWLVVWSVAIASLLGINQAMAEIAVIVHPSNSSSFDKSTIKKLFLGKNKAFSNGRTAFLLNAKTNASTTEEFNQKVIGKSNSQVNAYWSKMIFTGKGKPPQEMSSDQDILAAITANQDAIGYIDAAAATGAVKVVAKF